MGSVVVGRPEASGPKPAKLLMHALLHLSDFERRSIHVLWQRRWLSTDAVGKVSVLCTRLAHNWASFAGSLALLGRRRREYACDLRAVRAAVHYLYLCTGADLGAAGRPDGRPDEKAEAPAKRIILAQAVREAPDVADRLISESHLSCWLRERRELKLTGAAAAARERARGHQREAGSEQC